MKFFNRKHLYIPHKLVIILGGKKSTSEKPRRSETFILQTGERGVVGHQTGSQFPLSGNMSHV